MSKIEIQETTVKQLSVEFSTAFDKNSFADVTEWANGEGATMSMSSKIGHQSMELTWEEIDVIIKLLKKARSL